MAKGVEMLDQKINPRTHESPWNKAPLAIREELGNEWLRKTGEACRSCGGGHFSLFAPDGALIRQCMCQHERQAA